MVRIQFCRIWQRCRSLPTIHLVNAVLRSGVSDRHGAPFPAPVYIQRMAHGSTVVKSHFSNQALDSKIELLHRFAEFVYAILHRWAALLTGGLLIALLWIYQGYGHPVPPWVYGTVGLFAFLPAAFYTWKDQVEKVEKAEAQLRRIDRPIPELVLSWEFTDPANLVRSRASKIGSIFIENRGPGDAHNINIEPISISRTKAVTATFPSLPLIRTGDKQLAKTVLVGNIAPPYQENFEAIFYNATEGAPEFVSEYKSGAYRIQFPIIVSFQDYKQNNYRMTFQFNSDDWFGKGLPVEIRLKSTEIDCSIS